MRQKIKTSFAYFFALLVLLAGISAGNGAICTWTGAGNDELASNPDNWSDSIAPTSGDSVVLSSASGKNMTWDLNVSLLSWTQDNYAGTVTIGTEYASSGFAELVITGDCNVNSGVWTHKANATKELYRLRVKVLGDFELGENASIDTTGKGYTSGNGPGKGSGTYGAAYGGRGT
ncbi:MAG: hypothetical protein GX811_00055, partial [Lentisphaerae bacterium]|nr:hypothetical protein [Lentisphaerota bacterium]